MVIPHTLEDIWSDQEAFNRNFVNYKLLADDQAKEEWLYKYWRACVDELGELIRKTNFKVHKLRRKPLNFPALNEELIDIFKYWLSMAQILGMDVDTFREEYHRKSEVVRDKWERELLKLKQETKVAVFDLDGVLNQWPVVWLNYLNLRLHLAEPMKVEDMKSFYVSESFPISRDMEEELKAKFLKDGGFANIMAADGASEVTTKLKANDYIIAIVTGRPYSHVMHYDTATWLKNNKIPYDLLIWGEEKKDTIMDEIAPAAPAFIVEDKPSSIAKLRSYQYVTYVMGWPYNQEHNVAYKQGQVERIDRLYDLLVKVPLPNEDYGRTEVS